jgi:hypothetical protein
MTHVNLNSPMGGVWPGRAHGARTGVPGGHAGRAQLGGGDCSDAGAGTQVQHVALPASTSKKPALIPETRHTFVAGFCRRLNQPAMNSW